MKKIRQGRDRRQQRQLEAAERQVQHTARLLNSAKVRKINPVEVEKLENRLVDDNNRLTDLKAGNYPR